MDDVTINPGESVESDLNSLEALPSTPVAVPEPWQGRTPQEVFEEVQLLKNTNKVNEEVIRRLSEQRSESQQPAAATPPVIPQRQVPVFDPNRFDELYQQSPAEAIQYMQSINNAQLEAALEQRLAPLAGGAVSSAEQQARQQYALEFSLFEKDIAKAKSLVQDPTVLSNPNTWKEMISYVRGQDGNIQRYIEAMQKQANVTPAHQQVQQDVGFSPTTVTQTPSARRGSTQLDSLQRKIAYEFGMTEDEYIRFDNSGDVLRG